MRLPTSVITAIPTPDHRHERQHVDVEGQIRGGKLRRSQPADQKQKDGKGRQLGRHLQTGRQSIAQQTAQKFFVEPHVLPKAVRDAIRAAEGEHDIGDHRDV